MGNRPTPLLEIGSIVHYETRHFECPGMVVATSDSIYEPEDGESYPENLYQPSEDTVHLMIYTPHPPATVRLETNVKYDPNCRVGTYHWPDECD